MYVCIYMNFVNCYTTKIYIYIYIYIYIRGVTVHKMHGSFRYDRVVSPFGMFSIRGGGKLEIFLF